MELVKNVDTEVTCKVCGRKKRRDCDGTGWLEALAHIETDHTSPLDRARTKTRSQQIKQKGSAMAEYDAPLVERLQARKLSGPDGSQWDDADCQEAAAEIEYLRSAFYKMQLPENQNKLPSEFLTEDEKIVTPRAH